jgi:hypothetical protein
MSEKPSSLPNSPAGERRPVMTRLGGSLGFAASMVGLAIFFAACAGFDGAFKFSAIPVLLAGVGLTIAIVGGWMEWPRLSEDTSVLAAIFVCAIGLLGGLLEMAMWLNWAMFSK